MYRAVVLPAFHADLVVEEREFALHPANHLAGREAYEGLLLAHGAHAAGHALAA